MRKADDFFAIGALRVKMRHQSHIMRRAILVSTDCRCAIYWTLYSSLLDNSTHQLNSVGPDQTPYYAVSHLRSHCLYICPVYEMLCSNRLDRYDVITNVANYDIQSAKSAGPDQMPHCAESHLGSHSLYYVP